MNAMHTAPTTPTRDTVVPPVSTRRYSERTTGTGYGRSSGYASARRYTSDWGQVRFRCR
ncbi:MAG: hypothetical protein KF800_04630 [Lysobacter sp.]|jgi:hypothetical protein|nr:hypothetical protein [Lysobacter sp.]